MIRAYLSLDAVVFLFLAMVRRVRWCDRLTRQARTRYMYRTFTRIARAQRVHFLNYGYAYLDPDRSDITLDENDEPNRVFIQLYDRVTGKVDLRGRDVLELSCGHGGGASYVARYLRPASMIAVDLNARGIKMCKRSTDVEGLRFQVANALDLPFPNSSFDAVLNVEASHCYPSIPIFLAEVHRVLKPGGHFLFADLRWTQSRQDELKRQLADSGMEIIEYEDMTSNVVAALEQYAERRQALIGEVIPRQFRKLALGHFAVPGTSFFERFANGEGVYFRYVLRKA